MAINYKIVGKNIKAFRDKYNYTQLDIANFLDLKDHVTISYYENGDRNIPLNYLTKIADLFNVELEDLLTEDIKVQQLNRAFAFRKDDLNNEDLITIANFHKIVKNYLKIRRLEEKHGV